MKIELFLNLHKAILTFQAGESLHIFSRLIGLFGNKLNEFEDIHEFILMHKIYNMQWIG